MSDITAETVVRRVALPGSRVQDEMVFFDPAVGKYYATGTVGADIWDFLDTPKTVGAIFDHVGGIYDVERNVCEAEVRTFISQMIEAGLVAT